MWILLCSAQSSAFLVQQLRVKEARQGDGLQMTLANEDLMVTTDVNIYQYYCI